MSKDDLRQQAKKFLQTITPADQKTRSLSIWTQLFEEQIWKQANPILAYSALSNEVDTHPLYQEIINSGKTLFLPHIQDQNMSFYKVEPGISKMSIHKLGFLQPRKIQEKYCEEKYPHALLIAPALAANNEGYRLGRGGGFYDRFLETHRLPDRKIIIIFKDCLWSFSPENHDRIFDYILCEQGLLKACPKTYYIAH